MIQCFVPVAVPSADRTRRVAVCSTEAHTVNGTLQPTLLF